MICLFFYIAHIFFPNNYIKNSCCNGFLNNSRINVLGMSIMSLKKYRGFLSYLKRKHITWNPKRKHPISMYFNMNKLKVD